MSFLSRITNVFRPDRLNREIDEEFRTHIEEGIATGRDPAAARRAFGSSLRQREASRDVRVMAWMESLRADAVFGWRRLAKTKVTSAAAILSLALAIGACTSAFRLIDALFLRPLPVANPERLHVVSFQGSGADAKLQTYDSSSYPMFLRMREALRGQAELVAASYAERTDLTYRADSDMEKANRQFVSGWMFRAFGLRPALGRVLADSDDTTPGAHPYAVLSYDYWSRRFGRDPAVIGRRFRMGNDSFEVVGVSAEGFTGTETGTMTDVFVPMAMKNPRTLASYSNFWLRTLVHLNPGVAVETARDRLRAAFHAIQEERARILTLTLAPRQMEKFFEETLLLEPAASGSSNLQRDYRRSFAALAILVLLVLLIACANVANLMTVRATARAREMALRVSIGAGRSRLVQLVLIESAWITFLAMALAALFAWWSAPFIAGMIGSSNSPTNLSLPADWRVLGFGLALAACVTVLFGLPAALRASAVQPVSALKGGADPHSRRRLMHTMIAAQVAFCFVVLFVAGMFISSFDRLSSQPTGFSSERILNLETLTSQPQPPAFWYEVADRLRAVPGVERVAMAGWPLMSGESAVTDLAVGGQPPSGVNCDVLRVSQGWTDTLKVQFIDGRDFRPDESAPAVAIVNEAFARQYFEGRNPVGQSFDTFPAPGGRIRTAIVGFVRDVRLRDNLRLPVRPTAWIPFHSGLTPLARGTFVIRTSVPEALRLATALRQEVASARSGFRVSNVRTQTEIVQAATSRERLLAALALFFAVVALLLAGVGLYGVLDYSVLQQRREIGIRVAIGARRGDIARRVTSDVFLMVLGGAFAGLGLGTVSVRYIETLIYQVKPTDIRMLALPSMTIAAIALLAALPAVVRAVRIDPAKMLRAD